MSFPHQVSTSSPTPLFLLLSLSSSLLSCDLLPKMLPEKQQEAEQRHTQRYEQSTGLPPGRAPASTLPPLSLQTPLGTAAMFST